MWCLNGACKGRLKIQKEKAKTEQSIVKKNKEGKFRNLANKRKNIKKD